MRAFVKWLSVANDVCANEIDIMLLSLTPGFFYQKLPLIKFPDKMIGIQIFPT